MSDHKPKLLDSAAPIPDRLRTHAHRMTWNETISQQNLGHVTEQWERDDLLAVLDAAADENEAQAARIAALEAERDDLAREVAAYEAIKAQSDAAGGPGVMRRQMELRRYKVRAEAAEAERDKLRARLKAAVEYMESRATAHSEPYPLAKCRATLAETEGRGDG